jgi:predicted  nucleic acid-binding Zn-ribbon protein
MKANERIRALEAELSDLKEREIPAWRAYAESAESHMKVLETELAECLHRYEMDVQPEMAAAVARAEKAEARVKELESALRGALHARESCTSGGDDLDSQEGKFK